MTPATEYLCIEPFLRTAVDARSLGTALEVGLIDHLLAHPFETDEVLSLTLGIDADSLRFLLGLLAANRVVSRSDSRTSLDPTFVEALRFRDIMEAKIDFANIVAPDFIDHFTALLTEPRRFMERARLFRLFDYNRCFDDDIENRKATQRWVRFTSALTRYEARAVLEQHDFSPYRRMMDVGGNSGEFVLQLCKRHPDLQATVVDLPVVCRIGREHVATEPESSRITFHEANALADPLPVGFDLVSFKSVLHDWPEAQAEQFVTRAAKSLRSGGTLMIYEREKIEIGPNVPPYSMIPMLLFFHYFRSPDFYTRLLAMLGLGDIEVRRFDLEMPFFLVTARLPV